MVSRQQIVEVERGKARLVVTSKGGCIASLDVEDKPLLRGWHADELPDQPFQLASFVLVPFSNRISNGAFSFEGHEYRLKPNVAGEGLPIHGSGFQQNWEISQRENGLILLLGDGECGPFQFRSQQDITLEPNSLCIELSISNTGEIALPFGCGFHPWFPRDSHTELAFKAESVWLEDENHLPTEAVDCDRANLNFARPRNLPDSFMNNAFSGWHHSAEITQGEKFNSCRVRAAGNLNTAIVYSPGSQSDFFCFEPVSHAVDAHNSTDMPGLQRLAPQETLRTWMKIDWN